MSAASSAESARAVNVALVRSGAYVLGVAAVLIVIGCGVAQGWDGALGGLLGVLLVVVFFGVDVGVFLLPAFDALTSTTVIVLLYVAKLVVFASLVVGLAAVIDFDHGAFVVAVVIEASVAGAMAIRAFSRMRVPYVRP